MAEEVKDDHGNTLIIRRGLEGSRWYNQRPSSAEVADWWEKVVVPTLHEEIDPGRYLAGLMLIQNVEKVKDEIVGYKPDGSLMVSEVKHIVFTPYPKVDVRIQYFWDLMEKHPDWYGVIEPVGGDPSLPPGFRIYNSGVIDNGQEVRFMCCTQKVSIYKRDTVKTQMVNERGKQRLVVTGELIKDAPPATKMVKIKGRWGADEHALMKAETGAVGRALGMAGILVVPGAGVATAEDMQSLDTPQEAQAQPQAEAAAPPPDMTEEELRKKAAELTEKFRLQYPEEFNLFSEWAKSRNFGKLSEMQNPALRSLVKKLERDLVAAEVKAIEAGGGQ